MPPNPPPSNRLPPHLVRRQASMRATDPPSGCKRLNLIGADNQLGVFTRPARRELGGRCRGARVQPMLAPRQDGGILHVQTLNVEAA